MLTALIVPCFIVFVSLILFVVLIAKEVKSKKQLEIKMRKMAKSKMFASLLPMLYQSAELCISSLHIDINGVIINYIYSGQNYRSCFNLQANGYYQLSNSNIEVISQLIEREIPLLCHAYKYSLEKTEALSANGMPLYKYSYYISPAYRRDIAYYKANNFAINTYGFNY